MIILYLERRNYQVESFNIYITSKGKEHIRLSLRASKGKELSFDIPYSLTLEEKLINFLSVCPEEVALLYQREGRPTFGICKLPRQAWESYLVAVGIPFPWKKKKGKQER